MARIVVVDDARDFTDLVTEILREGRHDVVACNWGDEALACIIREHPDMVLLDIRFGDQPETGWEILDQLRNDPLTASIPVVVSSAAQDSLLAREEWLQQRGVPILPKPFDLDELLGVVEAVLNARTGASSGVDA